MDAQPMVIEISNELIRFKDHLDLHDNNRIIFSGKFGTGKTYFLNEFFKGNNEFDSFIISPVNFSVSKNEDIFELIKYEIAFQLLGKNEIDFEKQIFSKELTAQFYVEENFIEILALLARGGSEIGKAVSDVYDNLKKLKENIDSHHETVQQDEKEELSNYLKKFTLKEGSIYEENRITELITTLIENLKEKGKKIALVIDDLDRLDPDHIFRILNVFASHLNFYSGNEVKFGFDKIILVCDIENIRNLFAVKFGQNMDFSGYIDKFYSREVFYYDNRQTIKNCIKNILAQVKIDPNPGSIDLSNSATYLTYSFSAILYDLIHYDLMNLRTLLKYNDKNLAFPIYEIKNFNLSRLSNLSINMYLIFEFLLGFYGSKSSLFNAILLLSNKIKYKNLSTHRDYFIDIITLANVKQHNFIEDVFKDTNTVNNTKFAINYQIIKSNISPLEFRSKVQSIYINDEKSEEFPFGFYINKALSSFFNIKDNLDVNY